MKNFDYAKAVRIINTLKPISADLGFREDWFWTAFTVYEDGKFRDDIDHRVKGSYWATPILCVHFADNSSRRFECHDNGPSENPQGFAKHLQQNKGCLSGPTDSYMMQMDLEQDVEVKDAK